MKILKGIAGVFLLLFLCTQFRLLIKHIGDSHEYGNGYIIADYIIHISVNAFAGIMLLLDARPATGRK